MNIPSIILAFATSLISSVMAVWFYKKGRGSALFAGLISGVIVFFLLYYLLRFIPTPP